MKSNTVTVFLVLAGAFVMGKSFSQKKGTLVYILCDYSSSVQDSNKEITTNIFNICQQLPDTSPAQIKIFRVSSENAPGVISDVYLDKYEPQPGRTEVAFKYERRAALIQLARQSFKGFTTYKGKDSASTCLRKTLELLGGNLRNSTAYDHVYLLIFSDMLEACDYNGKKINFEKTDASSAITWLRSSSITKPAFTGIPNLTIGVFISSTYQTQYSNWKDFWDLWFRKNGYRSAIEYASTIDKYWIASH